MKRRAARVDANQAEVVKALRKAGCSVRSLASVGDGMPDLLVGYGRVNVLLEVKDGSKPLSKQRLTKDERAFFMSWRGFVRIVNNAEGAVQAVIDHVRRR
jgi:Holliday junction resolvase